MSAINQSHFDVQDQRSYYVKSQDYLLTID